MAGRVVIKLQGTSVLTMQVTREHLPRHFRLSEASGTGLHQRYILREVHTTDSIMQSYLYRIYVEAHLAQLVVDIES